MVDWVAITKFTCTCIGFISAAPPVNLTHGPPVSSAQFSGGSNMHWSDDPIQQQQPLASSSQVVPGTPAGNPPHSTATSYQGAYVDIGYTTTTCMQRFSVSAKPLRRSGITGLQKVYGRLSIMDDHRGCVSFCNLVYS